MRGVSGSYWGSGLRGTAAAAVEHAQRNATRMAIVRATTLDSSAVLVFQPLVRGQREEVRQFVRQRRRLEQLVRRAAGVTGGVPYETLIDATVRLPLPYLRTGDLRRGRVLHQVVDGDGAVAPQPRVDVFDSDLNVA